MYCTHCGAMLVEDENFCAKCGKEVLLPEEQREDDQAIVENGNEAIDEIIVLEDQIVDNAGADGLSRPPQPMQPSELAALQDFIHALGSHPIKKKKGFQFYLEIDSGSRKTLITLVGMLPLISKDAEVRGIPVVYVTPDTGSMSGARLDFRSFMILGANLEFFTWDELNTFFQRGIRPHECWVIGDFDWRSTPVDNPEVLKNAKQAISTLALNKKTCFVFVHQEGHHAIVDPSPFRAYKGFS